ncbi:MAG: NAD-dependent dihydropyrimidine dehydrogenase subunit PreA [Gammaproteobacteria bacterium]|nr:NAD-dependent dihydropyrimidine dehydrogenase subunit PreA [Gammaproteobacteria bacterium]
MSGVDLSVEFCGVTFQNPFVLAAAPSTDSKEMIARGFEAGWAGAVLKTTSVESEEVSIAYPIMASLEPGSRMVGLHNIDLISERHVESMAQDVLWLKERFPDHRVAMSIVASTREEWDTLIRRAEEVGADLVELSISCPQGSMLEDEQAADGWMISQDARLTEKVTRWAKESATRVPIYVKLSPAVTDIAAIARAVVQGGGDGICAIDSVEGIVGIDLESLSPLPSVQGYGSHGGYTGRAIKPIALRCVADIASAVQISISGVGGIYSWRDAVEFLLLGATTVQVCTAVMHKGFSIVADLRDGLARWLEEAGYLSPREVVGLSLPHLTEHDELPHGVDVVSRINLDLCIGCGLCHVACEDGGHQAIDFGGDRKPVVDEEDCVGCGLCAQVCPVPDCISIQPAAASAAS